jgi:membrane fusion protein (multidrug efflux system)
MRKIGNVGIILLLLSAPASAQTIPPKAIPVGVVAASFQPVTRATAFAGRIEATERVDVRARVTGYLDEVLFKEGETANAGAPLFRIEKAPFEAAVLEARGALLQAQGTYANASIAKQRAEELVKTSATSVANRDERAAAEQNARGAVIRAEADLRTANINLSYTDITAPISGRIGRSALTKGNVVGPDAGVLTVILSEDPIYAVFPVSQRDFLEFQKAGAKLNTDTLVVRITFSDGSMYPLEGKINFVDVKVDRTTDTVLVRASFPNPKGVLVDGQFVNVQVQGDKPEEKVVIPQSSLMADQGGTYVLVADDGRAAVRRVKVGGNVGPNVAVLDGLKPGDLVIVEGLQGVRPDAPVLASPISLSAQSN